MSFVVSLGEQAVQKIGIFASSAASPSGGAGNAQSAAPKNGTKFLTMHSCSCPRWSVRTAPCWSQRKRAVVLVH